MVEKSPFYELSQKHKAEIEYMPFIRVVGVSLKEFRSQRVEILEHALNVKVGGEEKKSTPPPFFEFYKERGDLK